MFKRLLILIVFCLSISVSAENNTDANKPEMAYILYGRKDYLRNKLIESNNKLCENVLNAYNGQFQSLTNIVEMLRQENVDLKRENTELRGMIEGLKTKKK